jgi:putative alpha-1,2-mannosidase
MPIKYIQKMTVNGAEYDKNYLDHSQLQQGADIHYTMSSESPTSSVASVSRMLLIPSQKP